MNRRSLAFLLIASAACVRSPAFGSAPTNLGASETIALAAPFALSAALALPGSVPCQPEWAPTFGPKPGVDGAVYSMTTFDDGSGPALFAGGEFTSAGGVTAHSIAKWDGARWSSLGDDASSGIDGTVSALAVFDDGSGPALFAGGSFASAGGVIASNIAKWNGVTWSAVGRGTDGAISALTVFDDGHGRALYAGGSFNEAGVTTVHRIAKWNGATWSALGAGVNNSVYALTTFDDGGGPALYAGGWFTLAGGQSARKIAKWNGTSWSALGAGMANEIEPASPVHALTVFDDGNGPALYAGGHFVKAGGVDASHVARWNGTSWSALGRGTDAAVKTLAVFDDGSGPALYAGGAFFAAGSVAANRVAKWSGARWSNVGDAAFGSDAVVLALQPFDDGGVPILFAGGTFAQLDDVEVDSIARWDGSEWTAIGRAPNDAVAALIEFDDGGGSALYATGRFQSVDGIPASRIGKWDGSSWSPLGRGVGGSYGILTAPPTSGNALAVYDDGSGPALYVGGTFRTAGNVVANRIAKWNGASWSALAGGMSLAPNACCASVDSLAVFDDGGGPALYAGGFFDAAGGVTAHSLAKWDGTSWSALATELDASGFALVSALTVFDDGSGRALYVGGGFLNAGGSGASYVAKWDGTSWSTLGAGTDGLVQTLAVFDDGSGPALFAGGQFTTAGGVPASHVAKWNGSQWSALGGGMNDDVLTITSFDDGSGAALCAGGLFTTAGGVSANRIAKWNGSSWSALGRGVNHAVSTARIFDDGRAPALYVGGYFTTAFDSGDSFVAKWACDPTPP